MDDSHEISSLIFAENKKKKVVFCNVVRYTFEWHFKI